MTFKLYNSHDHDTELCNHGLQCTKYHFRCRRKEYGLEKLSEHEVPSAGFGGKTILTFLMLGTNYYERKQFLIYDLTNFIADFGGYLGLLLGCSLLTFYDLGKAWISRLCQWMKHIRDRGTNNSALHGRSFKNSARNLHINRDD